MCVVVLAVVVGRAHWRAACSAAGCQGLNRAASQVRFRDEVQRFMLHRFFLYFFNANFCFLQVSEHSSVQNCLLLLDVWSNTIGMHLFAAAKMNLSQLLHVSITVGLLSCSLNKFQFAVLKLNLDGRSCFSCSICFYSNWEMITVESIVIWSPTK